ncbi:MAG: hypothetical protein ACP5QG_09585 [candidate division WOR-3 bacterium]
MLLIFTLLSPIWGVALAAKWLSDELGRKLLLPLFAWFFLAFVFFIAYSSNIREKNREICP